MLMKILKITTTRTIIEMLIMMMTTPKTKNDDFDGDVDDDDDDEDGEYDYNSDFNLLHAVSTVSPFDILRK